AANRFFERRSRLTISVPASPSASRIVARGRKPACLYTSNKRRFGLDPIHMPKRARFSLCHSAGKPNIHKHRTRYDALEPPTRIHEEPELIHGAVPFSRSEMISGRRQRNASDLEVQSASFALRPIAFFLRELRHSPTLLLVLG